ncbi:hypothetical protein LTS17_007116 [Exophiala oligosperma]
MNQWLTFDPEVRSGSSIPHTPASANQVANSTVRRVKCDENKPACDKCTSTGRKCDGYSSEDDPKATGQVLSARPSHFVNVSAHEFRAFQFFHEQTRFQLSGFHDCELWDMLVLQAAQEDIAVRHALVAFSTLHEAFARRSREHDDDQTASDQLALRQYNLAIRRHLDRLGGSDFPCNLDERAMVPCLIFIGIETIGYDAWDAQGSRSSISYRPLPTIPSAFASATEARDVWEMYWHIYTAASARESQVAAPYDIDAEPLYDNHKRQQDYTRPDFWVAGFLKWSESLEVTIRLSTSTSTSTGGQTSAPPVSQKEQCALKILQMYRLLNDTLVDMVSRQTLEDLEIDSQMHWDHSTPIFEQMLDLAESVLAVEADTGPHSSSPTSTFTTTTTTTTDSPLLPCSSLMSTPPTLMEPSTTPKSRPVFTLDTSIVSPIYDIAKRSRDPMVRRRAISLLYTYPRHEGMYDGVLYARVAQRIMQLEEGRLDHQPTSASDVPDWARLSGVRLVFDLEKRRLILRYERCRDKHHPFRVPVEEIIDLD